ncbi:MULTISPECIES: hypothetical protein [unclassified Frondihabitans]|uniref:hypothetical protein n=1 Tax=unclassified Frondihabitans TaxID=2626248 RepID=UPI000F500BF6|nr:MULTISPECIES: hypothetical protein [unclassified Frondihabitans]
MSYSDILATTALAASLAVAALSEWRNRRWERPVMLVSGKNWMSVRGTVRGGRVAGFSLEVVNIGNHDTQVVNAYWEIDRGDREPERYAAVHGGGGVESLFEPPDYAEDPDMPFNLGRYERSGWNFEVSLQDMRDVDQILRARPAVTFISRKSTESAYGAWHLFCADEATDVRQEGHL